MKRILLPFVIFVVLIAVGMLVLRNPPEANRGGGPKGPQTVVEVITVQPRDYPITVASYGTVQPRTRSVLVAQVAGQIVDVAENFRAGGFFSKGDVLLNIDPRDYEAAVSIAEATLMDALQAEAQEQARAEQAQIDWQRIGEPGEVPSDLVLRKPQLKAAEARVVSARSSLTRAKLDLERTSIRAPYSGRVLRQSVDLGQVVTGGAQLGEVYATDYAEVRLPLRTADLAFVALPEGGGDGPAVTLTSSLGVPVVWQARIVRTEGAIDEVARQLHVVAQVDHPYVASEKVERPLKIGEYVTAEIDGRVVRDALPIPAKAIYQNTYVYVVEDGVLQRRKVDIAWQNGIDAVVSAGVNMGDQLVVTPLGQVPSGTRVQTRQAGSS